MKVLILGDYNPNYPPHVATTGSIMRIGDRNHEKIKFKWYATENLVGTLAHAIYPKEQCEEDSNCGFSVNPRYHGALDSNNFVISGIDDKGEAKIFELKTNKFFVVTKFLPQMRSTIQEPHPLVAAWLKSV